MNKKKDIIMPKEDKVTPFLAVDPLEVFDSCSSSIDLVNLKRIVIEAIGDLNDERVEIDHQAILKLYHDVSSSIHYHDVEVSVEQTETSATNNFKITSTINNGNNTDMEITIDNTIPNIHCDSPLTFDDIEMLDKVDILDVETSEQFFNHMDLSGIFLGCATGPPVGGMDDQQPGSQPKDCHQHTDQNKDQHQQPIKPANLHDDFFRQRRVMTSEEHSDSKESSALLVQHEDYAVSTAENVRPKHKRHKLSSPFQNYREVRSNVNSTTESTVSHTSDSATSFVASTGATGNTTTSLKNQQAHSNNGYDGSMRNRRQSISSITSEVGSTISEANDFDNLQINDCFSSCPPHQQHAKRHKSIRSTKESTNKLEQEITSKDSKDLFDLFVERIEEEDEEEEEQVNLEMKNQNHFTSLTILSSNMDPRASSISLIPFTENVTFTTNTTTDTSTSTTSTSLSQKPNTNNDISQGGYNANTLSFYASPRNAAAPPFPLIAPTRIAPFFYNVGRTTLYPYTIPWMHEMLNNSIHPPRVNSECTLQHSLVPSDKELNPRHNWHPNFSLDGHSLGNSLGLDYNSMACISDQRYVSPMKRPTSSSSRPDDSTSAGKQPCGEIHGHESFSRKPTPRSFWNNRLPSLKSFKAEYGHCNVPKRYKHHKRLGVWCCEIRMSYKAIQAGRKPRSILNQEMFQQLNDIGFVWNYYTAEMAKVGHTD